MAHGEVTRLAAVVPLERVAVIMARQERPVTLVLVMAEAVAVEYQVALTQAAPEEMEVCHRAEEEAAGHREL